MSDDKYVHIKIPLYRDENTKIPLVDGYKPDDYISIKTRHMGMSCCCLQVTFEGQNIEHAAYLHDSFVAFTGIFGALSASAPIYKSLLADRDLRWKLIMDTFDIRTKEQRDPNSEDYIPKPRW